MNSYLLEFGYSPRTLKVGNTINISKPVKSCPWKSSEAKTIPVGQYKIVSRKGFVGGSQEIVRL
jgi:hypothetical protein